MNSCVYCQTLPTVSPLTLTPPVCSLKVEHDALNQPKGSLSACDKALISWYQTQTETRGSVARWQTQKTKMEKWTLGCGSEFLGGRLCLTKSPAHPPKQRDVPALK